MKVWGFLTTSVTIRHFSLCSLSSVLMLLMHTSGLKGTNNPSDPVSTHTYICQMRVLDAVSLYDFIYLVFLQESTNLNFIFVTIGLFCAVSEDSRCRCMLLCLFP